MYPPGGVGRHRGFQQLDQRRVVAESDCVGVAAAVYLAGLLW
jgi:hypothetical protein